MIYESGDFLRCHEMALEAAGYTDFAQRQKEALTEGRYIGIGVANMVKVTGRGPFESATVRVGRSGRVVIYTSAMAMGQGTKTTLAQICAEQLAVARGHEDWHRQRFGYEKSNVRFLEGDIEKLGDLDLPEGHFDVIVSNCVINLVADKRAVFEAAHRLLKPGGELYFSDVYSERRVPKNLRDDPVLHGECLSGALYWGDFLALAKSSGFLDPRLVTSRPLGIGDKAVQEKLDGIAFHSATYRLFKLDLLESQCEDYGQAVRYRGTVPGQERVFELDGHHHIEAGRMFPICGNSWKMLADTRFAEHFDFFGNFATHYGVFPDCGVAVPFGATGPASDASAPAACC